MGSAMPMSTMKLMTLRYPMIAVLCLRILKAPFSFLCFCFIVSDCSINPFVSKKKYFSSKMRIFVRLNTSNVCSIGVFCEI